MKYCKGDDIFLQGSGKFNKEFNLKHNKNITESIYFLGQYYGLNKGFFMLDPEDEASNYKFDKVLEKASLDKYFQYTENTIKRINELPNDIKYKIQKNDAFLINMNMVQTLPILMQKISEFIVLILNESILQYNIEDCSSENPIIKSITTLNGLIEYLNGVIISNKNKEETKPNYLLDTCIKEVYLQEYDACRKINDILKKGKNIEFKGKEKNINGKVVEEGTILIKSEYAGTLDKNSTRRDIIDYFISHNNKITEKELKKLLVLYNKEQMEFGTEYISKKIEKDVTGYSKEIFEDRIKRMSLISKLQDRKYIIDIFSRYNNEKLELFNLIIDIFKDLKYKETTYFNEIYEKAIRTWINEFEEEYNSLNEEQRLELNRNLKVEFINIKSIDDILLEDNTYKIYIKRIYYLIKSNPILLKNFPEEIKSKIDVERKALYMKLNCNPQKGIFTDKKKREEVEKLIISRITNLINTENFIMLSEDAEKLYNLLLDLYIPIINGYIDRNIFYLDNKPKKEFEDILEILIKENQTIIEMIDKYVEEIYSLVFRKEKIVGNVEYDEEVLSNVRESVSRGFFKVFSIDLKNELETLSEKNNNYKLE